MLPEYLNTLRIPLYMNCSSHEAAEVASLLPQMAALGGCGWEKGEGGTSMDR